MWVQILCGLVIYKICKKLFYDDDVLDVETSDSNAIFSVAARLEKLYKGKAYVGLRIPDPDTGSRQNIDIVLITKGEAVVISVKNLSGFVTVNADGSWVCEAVGRHRSAAHPDPVADAKKQASILESYLEQREVALPEGYLSYKVIIPNPKFRVINASYFPPEVISYDQWMLMKSENKSMLSGWIKGAFRGGKKEMQESIHQQLNFILSTAPIWDRLEVKGNKHVLGEFLEFKGKQEDIQALRYIKRSKVSRLDVQKTTPSRLQVLYSSRDYRSEGASSEWNEVTVRSSTEVLFQPVNSTKVRKFKLSSVTSMSLSA
ncbi:NERD domain-containing protein [Citrus sinensis]|uniref:NERD domain-containing protein n=1 Tax=Citrus sinensis TaxID=2711 RepID=A0ACB8MER2_CITSI|nr:NERD domain-containing protein [Citrus sinensis]